jgi:uncharacterized protein DUF4157
MPQSARSFFEPRFGYNFSVVRLHTGKNAVQATGVINAKAFTIGRDIVFGAGQYRPETEQGRSLLAHELTHVVQQGPSLQRVQRMVNNDAANSGNCPPGYTICDFIHERITVEAQYALSDKVRQGGEDCDIALSILGGVEKGELEGVYIEDQRKPALMARRQGKSWWDLIPAGKGVIVSELESPPMMVIKKQSANNRAQLAAEIKEAWQGSSFAGRSIAPLPPKLQGCAAAPPPKKEEPPPPPPPPKKEDSPESCKYPRCDTSVPTTVWATCGLNKYGAPYDCIKVPGEKCGICEGGSKNADKCQEENEKRHKIERKKCDDTYRDEAAKYIIKECGKDAVKCAFTMNPMACLKGLGCFVNPKPLWQYQECKNKESERYMKEGRRCKTLP